MTTQAVDAFAALMPVTKRQSQRWTDRHFFQGSAAAAAATLAGCASSRRHARHEAAISRYSRSRTPIMPVAGSATMYPGAPHLLHRPQLPQPMRARCGVQTPTASRRFFFQKPTDADRSSVELRRHGRRTIRLPVADQRNYHYDVLQRRRRAMPCQRAGHVWLHRAADMSLACWRGRRLRDRQDACPSAAAARTGHFQSGRRLKVAGPQAINQMIWSRGPSRSASCPARRTTVPGRHHLLDRSAPRRTRQRPVAGKTLGRHSVAVMHESQPAQAEDALTRARACQLCVVGPAP